MTNKKNIRSAKLLTRGENKIEPNIFIQTKFIGTYDNYYYYSMSMFSRRIIYDCSKRNNTGFWYIVNIKKYKCTMPN